MSQKFDPWVKYPSFTQERLCIIAGIIRDARHDAVLLHDIDAGDNDWSLGCRVYARMCHQLRMASLQYSWLRICDEYAKPLRFVIAVGSIPVRIYRGLVDDPPDRYLFVCDAEESQGLLALKLDEVDSQNYIFRLAVETNSNREASAITLAEINKKTAKTTSYYSIPLNIVVGKITPLQSQPVNVPPPSIEPVSPQVNVKKGQPDDILTTSKEWDAS